MFVAIQLVIQMCTSLLHVLTA